MVPTLQEPFFFSEVSPLPAAVHDPTHRATHPDEMLEMHRNHQVQLVVAAGVSAESEGMLLTLSRCRAWAASASDQKSCWVLPLDGCKQ